MIRFIFEYLYEMSYNHYLVNLFTCSRLMQTVITYVRCNDLAEPIIRVALERSKHQTSDHPFSIYRDILFLAFTVLGRTNIDQGGLHVHD